MGDRRDTMDETNKALKPQGDINDGDAKAGFEIIGAKHDDDDIKGRVAFHQGGQDGKAVAMGTFNGIIMDGGPSGLAFDNDLPAGKLGREMRGPAISAGHAAALAQGGHGKGGVGVAVTKKHDGAHG